MNRSFLFPQMYVLTDVPKIQPITRRNFFTIDIRPYALHERSIYSFQSRESLEYLKSCHDPYYITSIDVADLKQYCKFTKQNLIVVKQCYCTLHDRRTQCDIDVVYAYGDEEEGAGADFERL